MKCISSFKSINLNATFLLVLIFLIGSCTEDDSCQSVAEEGIPIFENLQSTGTAFYNTQSASNCSAYKSALSTYIAYANDIKHCMNEVDLKELQNEINSAKEELATIDCDLIVQCFPIKSQLTPKEEAWTETELNFIENPSSLSCGAYQDALNEYIQFAPSVRECIASSDLSDFDLTVDNAEASLANLDCDQLWVGTPYQGGIIAYFLQPDDIGYEAGESHGIIVAPTDQSSEIQWGCYSYVYDELNSNIPGASGTAIGTGVQNTLDFLDGCGEGHPNGAGAARLCADLIIEEYEDWHLPSKDELYTLYLNKEVVEITALAIGGTAFAEAPYWSSSETGVISAYGAHFGDGSQGEANKGSTFYVRAIRMF